MCAMYAPAGFFAAVAPVFEIRTYGGMTDLLVSNPDFGRALAETLADKSIALLRGHGSCGSGCLNGKQRSMKRAQDSLNCLGGKSVLGRIRPPYHVGLKFWIIRKRTSRTLAIRSPRRR